MAQHLLLLFFVVFNTHRLETVRQNGRQVVKSSAYYYVFVYCIYRLRWRRRQWPRPSAAAATAITDNDDNHWKGKLLSMVVCAQRPQILKRQRRNRRETFDKPTHCTILDTVAN